MDGKSATSTPVIIVGLAAVGARGFGVPVAARVPNHVPERDDCVGSLWRNHAVVEAVNLDTGEKYYYSVVQNVQL